jgi:hypothetical protein
MRILYYLFIDCGRDDIETSWMNFLWCMLLRLGFDIRPCEWICSLCKCNALFFINQENEMHVDFDIHEHCRRHM